jgi:hypothetical protein
MIRAAHLRAAVALVDYGATSIERIFGAASGGPDAEAILAALIGAGASGLSREQINRHLSGKRSSDVVTRALHSLAAAGRITATISPTGGRPKEVWRVR